MPAVGSCPKVPIEVIPQKIWLTALAIVVVAPLFLGANRPFVWSLLSSISFILLGLWVLYKPPAFHLRGLAAAFAMLLWLWLIYPFFQIVLMYIAAAIEPQLFFGTGFPPSNSLLLFNSPVPVDIGGVIDGALRESTTVIVGFLSLYFFRYRKFRNVFLAVLIISAAANAVFGMVNYFFDGVLLYFKPALKHWEAVTGTFVNKNHFASYLSLTLPVSIGVLIQRMAMVRGNRARGALDATVIPNTYTVLSLVTLMVVGLVLSKSLGAVLSLVFALMLMLLYRWGARNSMFHIGFLLSLAVFPFVLLFVNSLYSKELVSLASSSISAQARIVQWADVVESLKHLFLTGSGVGSFEDYFEPYKSSVLGRYRYDHAHNDYLEILVTRGLVGVSLLYAIIGSAFVGYRRQCKGDFAPLDMTFFMMWSIIAFCLHMLVDFNFHIPANQLIFVLLLSYVVAVTNYRTGTR